jgi:hypothetical protein
MIENILSDPDRFRTPEGAPLAHVIARRVAAAALGAFSGAWNAVAIVTGPRISNATHSVRCRVKCAASELAPLPQNSTLRGNSGVRPESGHRAALTSQHRSVRSTAGFLLCRRACPLPRSFPVSSVQASAGTHDRSFCRTNLRHGRRRSRHMSLVCDRREIGSSLPIRRAYDGGQLN